MVYKNTLGLCQPIPTSPKNNFNHWLILIILIVIAIGYNLT